MTEARVANASLATAMFEAWGRHTQTRFACVDRDHRVLYASQSLVAPNTRSPAALPILSDLFAPEIRERARLVLDDVFERGVARIEQLGCVESEYDETCFSLEVVPLATVRCSDLALVALHPTSGGPDADARFYQLCAELPDFVVTLDRARRITWVNRQPPGLSHEKTLGMPVERLITPEDHAESIAAIESVFETEKAASYEVRSCGERDRQHRYSVRVLPTAPENGEPRVLVLTTDITTRHREARAREGVSAQMEQSQRLESIGLLAGGVAHDFNNLLQVVMTNLHFARESVLRGEDPRDDLQEVERAAERAAELTSQLLAFGRRQDIRKRPVDLAELLERTARMLRRTIPASIAIAFEGPSEPCMAAVDVAQIEQVLVNLCLNARDAMPNGGQLTLAVQREAEERVAVRVRDTGVGIDAETRTRIFDPFFSTKPAGSGLGLAVAYGIVQQHGGELRVYSEPGCGTEFTLRLPRATAARARRCKPSAPAPAIATVLVAEDEPQVLRLVQRILGESGYRVLEAHDGVEALDQLERNGPSIDLVMLDAMMPRLNGWQVYERMARNDCRTPILFTSGYADSSLPGDVSDPSFPLIHKPYAPDALLSAVRRALQGPRPAALAGASPRADRAAAHTLHSSVRIPSKG